MFCPKCGTNAGDGIFCPNCGNRLPVLNGGNTPAAQQTAENLVTPVQSAVNEVNEAVNSFATAEENRAGNVAASAENTVGETAGSVEPVPMAEQVPMAPPVEMAGSVPSQPADSASPVQAETVQGTEQMQQTEAAQPIQSTQQTPPVQNTAKVQQTVTVASQMMNSAPQQAFTAQPPVKKKKKWPLVTGIVIAVAAVIAAVIFFAWPAIEGIISPKSKAVKALKSVTGSYQDRVEETLKSGSGVATLENSKVTGNYEVKKLVFGGVDYTDALKSKYIIFNTEQSIDQGSYAGTIGIGSDSSKATLSMEYYMNGTRLYFKFPQLSDQAFYVPVDTGDLDFSGVSGLGSTGSVDPKQLEQYMPYIEALLEDIFDAVDNFWENLDYDYLGKDTYKSPNGDIKVRIYDITIKEEVVKQLIKDMVENVLDDDELSSFTSLLAMTGYNKESLLKEIDKMNLNMPDIKFQMYINEDGEIIKFIVNLADYGSKQNGTVSIAFIGKDKPQDMVELASDFEDGNIKCLVGVQGDKLELKLDILPNQTEYPDEFLTVEVKASGSAGNMSIEELSAKGNIDGAALDISLSGESKTSSLVTLSKSASDFRGAVNPDSMTDRQMENFLSDVFDNRAVLEKILSDSLLNDILPEEITDAGNRIRLY